jgi:hypothetical protein
MGPHIPKNICICLFFLCPKYKVFFFKNLQICSARRLLHVDIFFKNIWWIFEKIKTGSMVPVHQINFPVRIHDFRSTWISQAILLPRIYRSSLWSLNDYKEELSSCTFIENQDQLIHVPYTVSCVQNQFQDTNAIYYFRRNVYINVAPCALFSYERGESS